MSSPTSCPRPALLCGGSSRRSQSFGLSKPYRASLMRPAGHHFTLRRTARVGPKNGRSIVQQGLQRSVEFVIEASAYDVVAKLCARKGLSSSNRSYRRRRHVWIIERAQVDVKILCFPGPVAYQRGLNSRTHGPGNFKSAAQADHAGIVGKGGRAAGHPRRSESTSRIARGSRHNAEFSAGPVGRAVRANLIAGCSGCFDRISLASK